MRNSIGKKYQRVVSLIITTLMNKANVRVSVIKMMWDLRNCRV